MITSFFFFDREELFLNKTLTLELPKNLKRKLNERTNPKEKQFNTISF